MEPFLAKEEPPVPEESLAELAEQVEWLEARQGPLSLETTAARHELAGALHAAGRLAEAEEQYTRAYQGFARVSGPTHLFTLTCMNNLALVLRDRRKWQPALELLATVHQARASLLGPAHPLTLNAANNFLIIQVKQGDLETAARDYPTLIRGCEEAFGPEDGTTHAIRLNYAHLLRRLGRHREAVELLGEWAERPVAEVLLGCARTLRYTGLFPVAMTASRYGAELTLSTHAAARTAHGPGEQLRDDELDIVCEVVGPDELEVPYSPDLDLLAPADQVADAIGALAEHLAQAERELGEQRLRVRVFVHHTHWPRLSSPPVLTVDRRLMSARDQARHDRLMQATDHRPVEVPQTGRRGFRRAAGGFSVLLPAAPDVIVSTVVGLDSRPAPSPYEA
ncbi:tetratricopeptide repeat protein [Streptomyces sp. NPDC096205]|uniref:tetratricopeptide repeat protein n=1 Tax=Streptomyces sp. NPDC096205 TaxID=3366081 RepID=UPI0037F6B48D